MMLRTLTAAALICAALTTTANAQRLLTVDEAIAESARLGFLDIDRFDVESASRILDRLRNAARELYPETLLPWEIHVAHLRGMDAHCSKGRILIYKELLLSTQPTPDEFAAIIAHEMGHCIRRDNETDGGVRCPNEYGADEIGLRLMRAANYDPNALPRMIQKFAAAVPQLWRAYPCGDRIDRSRAALARGN